MNKTAKRRCDTLIDYGELEMLKFMLVGGLYEQPFMFGHDRECSLGRFIKTLFWNFNFSRLFLCSLSIDKPMLENTFCSNVAPSA